MFIINLDKLTGGLPIWKRPCATNGRPNNIIRRLKRLIDAQREVGLQTTHAGDTDIEEWLNEVGLGGIPVRQSFESGQEIWSDAELQYDPDKNEFYLIKTGIDGQKKVEVFESTKCMNDTMAFADESPKTARQQTNELKKQYEYVAKRAKYITDQYNKMKSKQGNNDVNADILSKVIKDLGNYKTILSNIKKRASNLKKSNDNMDAVSKILLDNVISYSNTTLQDITENLTEAKKDKIISTNKSKPMENLDKIVKAFQQRSFDPVAMEALSKLDANIQGYRNYVDSGFQPITNSDYKALLDDFNKIKTHIKYANMLTPDVRAMVMTGANNKIGDGEDVLKTLEKLDKKLLTKDDLKSITSIISYVKQNNRDIIQNKEFKERRKWEAKSPEEKGNAIMSGLSPDLKVTPTEVANAYASMINSVPVSEPIKNQLRGMLGNNGVPQNIAEFRKAYEAAKTFKDAVGEISNPIEESNAFKVYINSGSDAAKNYIMKQNGGDFIEDKTGDNAFNKVINEHDKKISELSSKVTQLSPEDKKKALSHFKQVLSAVNTLRDQYKRSNSKKERASIRQRLNELKTELTNEEKDVARIDLEQRKKEKLVNRFRKMSPTERQGEIERLARIDKIKKNKKKSVVEQTPRSYLADDLKNMLRDRKDSISDEQYDSLISSINDFVKSTDDATKEEAYLTLKNSIKNNFAINNKNKAVAEVSSEDNESLKEYNNLMSILESIQPKILNSSLSNDASKVLASRDDKNIDYIKENLPKLREVVARAQVDVNNTEASKIDDEKVSKLLRVQNLIKGIFTPEEIQKDKTLADMNSKVDGLLKNPDNITMQDIDNTLNYIMDKYNNKQNA